MGHRFANVDGLTIMLHNVAVFGIEFDFLSLGRGVRCDEADGKVLRYKSGHRPSRHNAALRCPAFHMSSHFNASGHRRYSGLRLEFGHILKPEPLGKGGPLVG